MSSDPLPGPGGSPDTSSRVLVARCDNYVEAVNEADGGPCTGLIRYRWGMPEAACDTCGARCGVAVAEWLRVEGAAGTAAPADPPEVAPEEIASYDSGYTWPIKASEVFTEDAELCGASLVGGMMCIQVVDAELRCPRHGGPRKSRRRTTAAAARAPQPAPDLAAALDAIHAREEVAVPYLDDDEDVPARLDAAADAIREHNPYSCASGDLRGIATSLRLSSPEMRAAVAAALGAEVAVLRDRVDDHAWTRLEGERDALRAQVDAVRGVVSDMERSAGGICGDEASLTAVGALRYWARRLRALDAAAGQPA